MFTIDLTKDPILMLLLNSMIRSASRISIHDKVLNKEVDNLNYILTNAKFVDYDSTLKTVEKLAEIVKSYNLKSDNSGPQLSEIIFNFIQKLNELKTDLYLKNKYFTTHELEDKVASFSKLSK